MGVGNQDPFHACPIQGNKWMIHLVLFFVPHAILKVKVPLKVRVLALIFAHVKVLNVSMVQRGKPYCYHSSQWCVMWEKDFECLNHLMLHCPVVYFLWIKLFWGTILCWATPESCKPFYVRGLSFLEGGKRAWCCVSNILGCLDGEK